MGNFAEGVSQTPMNSQTQEAFAASVDTGFDHDDNVVEVSSPHGTGGSRVYQAKPVAVGVSAGPMLI